MLRSLAARRGSSSCWRFASPPQVSSPATIAESFGRSMRAPGPKVVITWLRRNCPCALPFIGVAALGGDPEVRPRLLLGIRDSCGAKNESPAIRPGRREDPGNGPREERLGSDPGHGGRWRSKRRFSASPAARRFRVRKAPRLPSRRGPAMVPRGPEMRCSSS